MQIFATFEYTNLLEIAITELEEKGVSSIYAVPLEPCKKEPRLLDGMNRADGMSFIDKGMILAFMFATVGASKGFVWAWGPVIWGMIGAGAGFLAGLVWSWAIYLVHNRRNKSRIKKGKRGEVILIVTCEADQHAVVEDILWDHRALGLAKTT
ncbi:hypothetical protein [Paenibacillus glycinis]|uniref:General stress protein 17M-like domain-containing protein n=1 Tax=Paenibacillus glycinis TaxID=2697035 RepID=A0ABW9XKS9_9BACL|nr:hypothetical protein [Paenibacillus glycinis]NBD23214.1 hypothetical protein [Paenibacillus glycinis]